MPRTNFYERYHHTDPRLVNLMEQMLQFKPENRISIKDALANPVFDEIRDEQREKDAEITA